MRFVLICIFKIDIPKAVELIKRLYLFQFSLTLESVHYLMELLDFAL